MPIDPSLEIVIWDGERLTSENGITFVVGNPFCIVLNWNVTGNSFSSTVAKNASQLVKNTPVGSSTKNDCDKGSLWVLVAMTVLFVCVVWVLWSVTASTETLAFLTETISSWTVSRIPVDEKFWSEILVAAFLSLEALLIKESVLLPVSNLGLLEIFGLGIKRESPKHY